MTDGDNDPQQTAQTQGSTSAGHGPGQPAAGTPAAAGATPQEPASGGPASGYGQPPPKYSQPGQGQPPPGYGQPPPGYGQPGQGQPPGYAPAAGPASGSEITVSGSTWWSLLAVVATAVAVSVPEDGSNDWKDIGVWAAFAIAAALATLAPAARQSLKLSAERAWQVAAGGLAGLVAFWILFVLPSISQNVSFLATVAVAVAGLAVWAAPGRPSDSAGSGTAGEWW